MNSARLHAFTERLWYGGSLLAWPLLPLSALYGVVVLGRRWLYQAGWLSCAHPGVPVIVVGNVTVGGTGKTPLVAWLTGRLRAAGFAPGIISRGYGSHGAGAPVCASPASTALEVGDEPILLARRTGVPVVICRDRVAGARTLATMGVNLIIADDGLQHYALARDLEIAVIDGQRQLGNGWLLPAGPLREPASRLNEADLVMVNGGQDAAGRLGFRLRARVAIALRDGEQRDLAAFSGQRVWSVAGIGNPGRFHAELRDRGMAVAAVPVPDHGRTDLQRLRRDADWAILMTEKDAVKYPGCTDPQVWFVPVEVEMPAESEAAIMTRILAVVRRP